MKYPDDKYKRALKEEAKHYINRRQHIKLDWLDKAGYAIVGIFILVMIIFV